eukprot:jgi/Mesvir1/25551/Mv01789-RA.4
MAAAPGYCCINGQLEASSSWTRVVALPSGRWCAPSPRCEQNVGRSGQAGARCSSSFPPLQKRGALPRVALGGNSSFAPKWRLKPCRSLEDAARGGDADAVGKDSRGASSSAQNSAENSGPPKGGSEGGGAGIDDTLSLLNGLLSDRDAEAKARQRDREAKYDFKKQKAEKEKAEAAAAAAAAALPPPPPVDNAASPRAPGPEPPAPRPPRGPEGNLFGNMSSEEIRAAIDSLNKTLEEAFAQRAKAEAEGTFPGKSNTPPDGAEFSAPMFPAESAPSPDLPAANSADLESLVGLDDILAGLIVVEIYERCREGTLSFMPRFSASSAVASSVIPTDSATEAEDGPLDGIINTLIATNMRAMSEVGFTEDPFDPDFEVPQNVVVPDGYRRPGAKNSAAAPGSANNATTTTSNDNSDARPLDTSLDIGPDGLARSSMRSDDPSGQVSPAGDGAPSSAPSGMASVELDTEQLNNKLSAEVNTEASSGRETSILSPESPAGEGTVGDAPGQWRATLNPAPFTVTEEGPEGSANAGSQPGGGNDAQFPTMNGSRVEATDAAGRKEMEDVTSRGAATSNVQGTSSQSNASPQANRTDTAAASPPSQASTPVRTGMPPQAKPPLPARPPWDEGNLARAPPSSTTSPAGSPLPATTLIETTSFAFNVTRITPLRPASGLLAGPLSTTPVEVPVITRQVFRDDCFSMEENFVFNDALVFRGKVLTKRKGGMARDADVRSPEDVRRVMQERLDAAYPSLALKLFLLTDEDGGQLCLIILKGRETTEQEDTMLTRRLSSSFLLLLSLWTCASVAASDPWSIFGGESAALDAAVSDPWGVAEMALGLLLVATTGFGARALACWRHGMAVLPPLPYPSPTYGLVGLLSPLPSSVPSRAAEVDVCLAAPLASLAASGLMFALAASGFHLDFLGSGGGGAVIGDVAASAGSVVAGGVSGGASGLVYIPTDLLGHSRWLSSLAEQLQVRREGIPVERVSTRSMFLRCMFLRHSSSLPNSPCGWMGMVSVVWQSGGR